jgi:hypothetical protein
MSNPKKDKNVKATAKRRGHQLPSRADDPLWALLQAEARGERRPVSQMVLILLEEALIARGRKVPSPSEEAE